MGISKGVTISDVKMILNWNDIQVQDKVKVNWIKFVLGRIGFTLIVTF